MVGPPETWGAKETREMKHAGRLALIIALVTAIAGVAVAAKVKVRVQHDKTFNFVGLKTYS